MSLKKHTRLLLVATAPLIALVAIACGSDPGVATSKSTPRAETEAAATTSPQQSGNAADTTPAVVPGDDEQTAVETEGRQVYLARVQQMMDVVSPTARMLGGLAIQISTAEDGAPGSVSEAAVSRDTIQLALDTLMALEPPADLTELHSTTIESVSTYLDAADVLVSDSEFTFDAYSEFQSLMARAGGQFHDASSLLSGAQR